MIQDANVHEETDETRGGRARRLGGSIETICLTLQLPTPSSPPQSSSGTNNFEPSSRACTLFHADPEQRPSSPSCLSSRKCSSLHLGVCGVHDAKRQCSSSPPQHSVQPARSATGKKHFPFRLPSQICILACRRIPSIALGLFGGFLCDFSLINLPRERRVVKRD